MTVKITHPRVQLDVSLETSLLLQQLVDHVAGNSNMYELSGELAEALGEPDLYDLEFIDNEDTVEIRIGKTLPAVLPSVAARLRKSSE